MGLLHLPSGDDPRHNPALRHGVACKFDLSSLGVHYMETPLSFQLIAVDELKNDYRNPVDFCQNLNRASAVVFQLYYMYFIIWVLRMTSLLHGKIEVLHCFHFQQKTMVTVECIRPKESCPPILSPWSCHGLTELAKTSIIPEPDVMHFHMQ